MFDDREAMNGYGRAQMLAEGILMDMSRWASKAGITVPVAMTRNAWTACVEGMDISVESDAACRASDLLLWATLLIAHAEALRQDGPTVQFPLHRRVQSGPRLSLIMERHAGDDGEEVMTIMLPWQD
ncbi:DUF6573 family protein [Variovorax sp. KK3]|uniref:DUF6573 family protein n=1 Tax=Variovorax sp. KK3 TaxID=1855728 RepID=UPI00097BCCFA|nr:DUF6573 family protein [Variovorax sp. KK3]